MTQKLEAESISAGLAVELTEVRRNLQVETDKLGILSTALGVVCDNLEVVRSKGTISLMARAIEIIAQVCQLKRNALHARVNQSFTIARSHYGDSIDLETMSLSFAPGYTDAKLDEIEMAMAPLSRDLADKIEDTVLPQRG